MENLSELYFDKLKATTNPGVVLASFYCVLYEMEVSKSEVMMFNKLLRVFGRFTVFSAIMDMAGSYPDKQTNVYPLIYTICKRKFESAHDDAVVQSREPLTKYINTIQKSAERASKQKIKIPSSEGLDKDA